MLPRGPHGAPATAASAAQKGFVSVSHAAKCYLWECSWLQIAELEAPLPPLVATGLPSRTLLQLVYQRSCHVLEALRTIGSSANSPDKS